MNITLLSAALLLTGCAAAVQPAPQEQSPPVLAVADSLEARSAAQEYLAVYPIERMMDEMHEAMLANSPKQDHEAITAARATLDVEALEHMALELTVRHFTVEEIRALTAFYTSPEGQSIMSKMPAYMADVMPAIQQAFMDGFEAALRLHRENARIGLSP